jgi:translation elongation factor EF-Tu-like GTPase
MPTNIAEYDGRRTRVIRNNEHILDDERKANLGFTYDAFVYNGLSKYKVVGSTIYEFTESEIADVVAFIDDPTDLLPVPVAPEPTAAEIQEAANKSAREFLDATDWYILRHTETGAEIPMGIAALRQAKRESIV